MPIGSLEQSKRKPSSLETLSSTEGTLESRISSNDIPKMELLKINYVNQCKQAVSATRSSPGTRSSASAVPNIATSSSKVRLESDPSRVYRYSAYKRPSSHPEISRKDHMIDRSPYESWDFLQNKRAIPTEPSKECPDCRDCCSDCSDCSSIAADSLYCSQAVEKSHSWNYRTKLSVLKKQDLGNKSQGERYMKMNMNKTNCEHDRVQVKPQRQPYKPTATKSCSDVSKIQQIFETAAQQRSHFVKRESEPVQRVNSRQADSPRRRTFSPVGSDERIKRLDGLQSYDSDCSQCRSNRRSFSELKAVSKIPKKTESRVCFDPKGHPDSTDHAHRQYRKMPEPNEKKAVEAKPQNKFKEFPIKKTGDSKDHKEITQLTSWKAKKMTDFKTQKESSERRNETNDQPNVQIKKIFATSQDRPSSPTQPVKDTRTQTEKFMESPPTSDTDLPLIDAKMLRKRNDKRNGGHHQVKVERVHIRKKRQSLLIINQLAESTHTSDHQTDHGDHEKQANHHNDEIDQKTRNTCGYKNCTYFNCPMSSGDSQKIIESDTDKAKNKMQLVKENNIKNLEKSVTNSPKIILDSPTTEKKKLSSVEDHRLNDQITIVVNRSCDPNDVQNFSNKNLTKATTDELLAPSVLNNTIVIKSPSKANISNVDVNLKKIENRKFNDLKNTNHTSTMDTDNSGDHLRPYSADHLGNSVKIFVRNYPVSCSSSADSTSLSDGDDRGRRVGGVSDLLKRYDSQQTASGSSCVTLSSSSTAGDDDEEEEEDDDDGDDDDDDDDDDTGSALSADLQKYQSDGSSSSSVTVSSLSADTGIQNVFSAGKLGCDGGIFWNNCYFYDGDKSNYCCSAISCDDDNCPYYNLDENNIGGHPTDQVDGCCREIVQKQQATSVHKRNPRKTDVIHDMRPRSMDGVIDSGVSLNGDTGSSPDSEHMQNQQDLEARRLKRGHVLSELLETERIYVTEMSSILKGYCDQMQSEEMMHLVPASLQGKEDILFGNLHELYTFHSEIFLKDLENCISTTELVALCFVQRRDTFYRLYSFYCQNIPRSERLRETLVDTHLFLQECQKRLGHKLPLAAYLLKPVQRITKYQLLLKDLLRFSDSGSCTKELQKALDCMLIVLKCVNDSMHQIAITGFPNDLCQQGELLLQDSFQVWTESKKDIRLRIKPQQRHIFLYQKSMLFCKQTSKMGHNKSTYQFKHYVKMSQIGLTESVRGDPKRFEVWLQGRQEVHTLQAPTIDVKNKWVAEIKRVLLNQLEELKGEKIKQYGLNHRVLHQTASWDTPNAIISTPQRTMSCEISSESNRNSNCSSDDSCPPHTPGVSSISSTEKENQDGCGWSSDYSNSEDEMSMIEDNSTPGSKFIALADYNAMGHSEVSMREGDAIELLKVGCAGWWFVRILDTNSEGWTPAAYLESINRKSSRSSSRNQERSINIININ